MLNNQQHDIIQNKPPISVYKTSSSQYPKTNSLFKMKISGSIPYILKEKNKLWNLN